MRNSLKPIPPKDRLPLAILPVVTLALSLAAAGDSTLPGDIRLARWLQAHPIPFAEPLTAFTNDYVAGRPLTVAGIALAVALLAARRTEAALLIVLATALRAANGILKSIADSPRPTPDVVAVTEQATGLGFPSGHAMGATLLFGAVTCLLWTYRSGPSNRVPPWPREVLPSWEEGSQRGGLRPRRWAATTACLLLILLTGYGRVYTGAHWPSDVVGGWLYGTLLLFVAIRITRLVIRGGAPVGDGRASRSSGILGSSSSSHPSCHPLSIGSVKITRKPARRAPGSK